MSVWVTRSYACDVLLPRHWHLRLPLHENEGGQRGKSGGHLDTWGCSCCGCWLTLDVFGASPFLGWGHGLAHSTATKDSTVSTRLHPGQVWFYSFIENHLRVSESIHNDLALGSLDNEDTCIDIATLYWITSHRRDFKTVFVVPRWDPILRTELHGGFATRTRHEPQRTATNPNVAFWKKLCHVKQKTGPEFSRNFVNLWPVWCSGHHQAFCLPSEFPHLWHVSAVVCEAKISMQMVFHSKKCFRSWWIWKNAVYSCMPCGSIQA